MASKQGCETRFPASSETSVKPQFLASHDMMNWGVSMSPGLVHLVEAVVSFTVEEGILGLICIRLRYRAMQINGFEEL